MKALVTGATGFLGSNLIRRLKNNGWKIKALVRNRTFKEKNIEIVYGDIKDFNSVKKASECVEVIFNLAAVLPNHNLTDEVYWQTNVLGVKNILKTCQKVAIKRIVHVSTVGIYATSNKTIDENSKLRLSSIYAKTKAEAEKLIFSYIKNYGLPITIIRPTIAYGPGDTRPGILNLFKLIKSGLFIPIGKGNNFFHTIFVENLVDGLILAATKRKALGQDFIMGDDPCSTFKEIIDQIAEVEGKKIINLHIPINLAYLFGSIFELFKVFELPAPLGIQRIKFMTENKKFSIEKAKSLLGYQPKVDLKTGLEITYNWYRQNGYLK